MKRLVFTTGATLAALLYASLASAATLQADPTDQIGNDSIFTFPGYTGGVSSTYNPGGADYWGSPFEYVNNVNLSSPFGTAESLQALGFDMSSFTYSYDTVTQTANYNFTRTDLMAGYTTASGNIQNIYQYDFANDDYKHYDASFGQAADFNTLALLTTLKSTQPILAYGVFDFQNSFVTYDGTNDPVSLAQILVSNNLIGYSFANGQDISISWLSEHPITSLTLAHAVPEPESWAMLLAGLGVMGVVARKRAKLCS
jgi:hypothetical protein